jgi:hypothetical protein
MSSVNVISPFETAGRYCEFFLPGVANPTSSAAECQLNLLSDDPFGSIRSNETPSVLSNKSKCHSSR